MLGSDLGHRRYKTLEKDDAESRSMGKAEHIFYSLSPIRMRESNHPEEEALTPETGRGNSLVESQMVSDTRMHTLSLKHPLWSGLYPESQQARYAGADPRSKGDLLF